MKKIALLLFAPCVFADSGSQTLFEDLWTPSPDVESNVAAPSSEALQSLDGQLTALVTKPNKRKSMTQTIGAMIKKTMMPSVLVAHKQAQYKLNSFRRSISRCRAPPRTLIKNWGRSKTIRRYQNIRCRRREAAWWKRMYYTGRNMKNWKKNMNLACRAAKHIKGNPAHQAKRCRPGGGQSYGNFVSGVARYFKIKLRKYRIMASRCSRARRAFYYARKRYTQSRNSWSKTRRICNAIQTSMEQRFCSFHLRVRNACRRYNSCFSNGYRSYRRNLPAIRKAESERKVQWRVLKRIQCLIPVMKKGGAKAIEKCRKIKHSTKHLNLKYPRLPARKPCRATSPVPCSRRYLNVVNRGIPGRAPPKRCNRCKIGKRRGGSKKRRSPIKKKKGGGGKRRTRRRRGLKCPRGTYQIGKLNSEISGCGYLGCRNRFRMRNIHQCRHYCQRIRNCRTFSYAGVGGNSRYRRHRVCILSHRLRPTNRRGPNQIFCGVRSKINWWRKRYYAIRRAKQLRKMRYLRARRRAAIMRRRKIARARRLAALRRARILRARRAAARRAYLRRRRPRYPRYLTRNRYVRSNSRVNRMVSQNRVFHAIMQTDCNFVIYRRGRAIWAGHTSRRRNGPFRLIYQSDNNLVVYNRFNRWQWASGGERRGGVYVIMQNDGNLVSYRSNRRATWARSWNHGRRSR